MRPSLLILAATAAVSLGRPTTSIIRISPEMWKILPELTKNFLASITEEEVTVLKNISSSSSRFRHYRDIYYPDPYYGSRSSGTNEADKVINEKLPSLAKRIAKLDSAMKKILNGFTMSGAQTAKMMFGGDKATTIAVNAARGDFVDRSEYLWLRSAADAYEKLPEVDVIPFEEHFPAAHAYFKTFYDLTEADKKLLQEDFDINRGYYDIGAAAKNACRMREQRIQKIADKMEEKSRRMRHDANTFIMSIWSEVVKAEFANILGDKKQFEELRQKIITKLDAYAELPEEAKEELDKNFPVASELLREGRQGQKTVKHITNKNQMN